MANTIQSERTDPALQHSVEQFLYQEAALLDGWEIELWLKLFTHDALYLIPAIDDPNKGEGAALALVFDDYQRLEGRVSRLLSRHAHANNPPPRTRRLITNVRVRPSEDGWRVWANFVIYSMRAGQMSQFLGEYDYRLIAAERDTFAIAYRRAVLDMETFWPASGKINIIV